MHLLRTLIFVLGLYSSGAFAQYDYSNCQTPASLPAWATRLVTLDINSTELALSLGLRESIVGVAGFDGWYQIMDEYQSVAKDLIFLAAAYPSLSQLQAAKPDLIIGGWKNGFSQGTPIEPKALLKQGMPSYVLRETCIHEKNQVSIPVTFANTLARDLQEIAHITGAEARAETLLRQIQARLDRVEADVEANGRAEPVRVFVYDGGLSEALTVGGEALLSEAIRVAGGRNIFADRRGTWQNADWQNIVDADPELIVIVDYGSADAIFKIQDLQQNPALGGLAAIRDKRFFVIPYAAAITGIRSVGITELLADHLICAFNPLSQGAKQCLDVSSPF